MISIQTVENLFEQIKNIDEINDLYEHKMNINKELSEMHKKLHALKESQGNMMTPVQNKAEILLVINSTNTLLDFVSDRIDMVRQKSYERIKLEKMEKSVKNKFMLVCKKLMPDAEYQKALGLAKRFTQEELEKMNVKELIAA